MFETADSEVICDSQNADTVSLQHSISTLRQLRTGISAVRLWTSEARTRSVLSGRSICVVDSNHRDRVEYARLLRLKVRQHQSSIPRHHPDEMCGSRWLVWGHGSTTTSPASTKHSARHMLQSAHGLKQRTDTLIGKTLAKPYVTDGRSHDSKLFMNTKVPG